jgi:anti-sigma B factor antagonist
VLLAARGAFAICKFAELLLSWNGTLADAPASVNQRQWSAQLKSKLTLLDPHKGEPLDIELRSQSGVKVIKLRGRLNLGDAVDNLRQNFDELLAAGDSKFVIDLGEVTMLDSSGIGLLVRCLTAAKQNSGSVKLLNPSKFAVQTLKMTGLLSLFEVFDNPDQAVASFG